VLTRRADVMTATTSISATKPAVAQAERSTAATTSDTTANWPAARPEALVAAHPTPSPPSLLATAATAISTARTARNAGPIETAASPMAGF
jgi:hypothetical protein